MKFKTTEMLISVIFATFIGVIKPCKKVNSLKRFRNGVISGLIVRAKS